jgi:hypothetical protein
VSGAVIVWAVLGAAGFVLLLWAMGRGVTAVAARVGSADSESRRYSSERLDGVRITAVVAGDGELLVSLAAGTGGPLGGVLRIAAAESSLARVVRWADKGTPLRACLSQDGTVLLADPALKGSAACEPSSTPGARARAKAAPQDHWPTDDR